MKLIRFGEIGREKPGLIDPEGALRSLEDVTRDDVPNPQSLSLWLDVDGHRYQDGNTRTMVFGVAYLVSYISQFMTLMSGDIISTVLRPASVLAKSLPFISGPAPSWNSVLPVLADSANRLSDRTTLSGTKHRQSFISTFGVQRLWRQ